MYLTLNKADIEAALLKVINDKIKMTQGAKTETSFELVTDEGTVPLFDFVSEVRVNLD